MIFSLIRSSSSVGEDGGAAVAEDGPAVDAGGAGWPADEDVAAPVPVAGVAGVLDLLVEVVLEGALLADLAGEAADVGELAQLAVGVDVAVLAARFLAERAVLGDVPELLCFFRAPEISRLLLTSEIDLQF